MLGVVAVVWPSRSAAPQARRPNIVLLMTDDMRADDLARMPATRRLIAAAGATFTRAYVSFPLCCPSRATLNSGQYAHNHGVRGNGPPRGGFQALTDRDNLLATWLQAAGYHTVHIGKYLNGYGTPGAGDAAAGMVGLAGRHRRLDVPDVGLPAARARPARHLRRS